MSTNLPSRNVPFTDRNGLINPIWHEFLRKFVSDTDEFTNGGSGQQSFTAGDGLTLNVDNVLSVGEGPGLAVDDNEVRVDIAGQSSVQAKPDDEIMIFDGNAIKKTTVRTIIEQIPVTSPGGSDTEVQFNNGGSFDGDPNFTTNGSGSVNISGDLDVDNININGNTISNTVSTDILALNVFGANTYTAIRNTDNQSELRLQSPGGYGTALYLTSNYQGLGGSGNSYINFGEISTTYFSVYYGAIDASDRRMNLAAGSTVGLSLDANANVRTTKHLTRSTSNNLTASTTQTQGQGALTSDINVVSTVANNNDTVTLPSAYSTNTYAGGQRVTIINKGANILQVYPASGNNLGLGTNTPTYVYPGVTAEFISRDSGNWIEISANTSSVTASITASTTQTQGQGALVSAINEVSTCANANDTVTLPSATAGRSCLVINNGANTLRVYPASGDNLGGGVDTATTITSGSRKMFIAFDSTNWEPVI